MGLVIGKKKKQEARHAESAQIDEKMMEDHDEDKQILKLLLLGAGESGKSTLFKQAIKLYGDGFDDKTLADYGKVVIGNLVAGMCTLCAQSKALGTTEEKCCVADENLDARDFFIELDIQSESDVELGLTEEAAKYVKLLWQDLGIRETFERRAKFQLTDSVSYFFDEIDRISEEEYAPTHQDVIRCRARTTGIIESRFAINDAQFQLMDVGGQRSERKKWIHCFENVVAVLFVAAINEYDQTCFEDNSTNRVMEALELFDKTCNEGWFQDASIILFLNKRDLFEEKIKKVDLNVLFEDYKGGKNYDAAAAHLTEEFLKRNKTPAVKVYQHVTCATDTENVQFTFDAVQKIILSKSLESAGLGSLE